MRFDFRILVAALAASFAGCGKSAVEQTGYAGDGRYEGQPPMCFQIDKQTRPSASTQYHHMVLFNNTCRYSVDCTVTNTLNDIEQHANVPANMNRNLLIAVNSEERSFDFDVDCSWTP